MAIWTMRAFILAILCIAGSLSIQREVGPSNIRNANTCELEGLPRQAFRIGGPACRIVSPVPAFVRTQTAFSQPLPRAVQHHKIFQLRMQLIDRRSLLFAGPVLTAMADHVPAQVKSAPAGGRLSNLASESEDVIHPSSLLGVWDCKRVVKAVEGDSEQAAFIWQALGGRELDSFSGKKEETFATRFINPPPGIQKDYLFEGESLQGVILDRGFEVI